MKNYEEADGELRNCPSAFVNDPSEHDCIEHLVPAYRISLIVVIDTLAILHACTHQIGHIYGRNPLAYIMGNGGMPEGVRMEREPAIQYLPDFLQPIVQSSQEMLDVAVIGQLVPYLLLCAYGKYIAVLCFRFPSTHDTPHYLIDWNGTWNRLLFRNLPSVEHEMLDTSQYLNVRILQ